MAAKPPTATISPTNSNPSSKPGFLNAFQKLGPSMYFYHPNFQENNGTYDPLAHPTAVPEPNLIVVCSWMGARARHIAKYTNSYIHRYPTIPILLLRNTLRDVVWTPAHVQIQNMLPAVTAVKSVFTSIAAEPRVLVHIFSNGGGWSAGVFSLSYERASGGTIFPVTALVLDSCPSYPRMRAKHSAISAALPQAPWVQYFGSAITWVLVYVFTVLSALGLTVNVVMRVRQVLNDPKGAFIGNGVPRVYICSRTDTMVHFDDVKDHMEEAKEVMIQTGIKKVQADRRVMLEEFEGSPHVGHLTVDQERYLRIMTKAWEIGIKCQIQNIQAQGSMNAKKRQLTSLY